MKSQGQGDKPPLSVGEKIRMLREHKGMTMDDFCEALGIRAKRVRCAEAGIENYSADQLDAIVKYFKIEGMPLTEHECEVSKERLYRWRNLLRAGIMDEAHTIRDEMADMVNLEPCDPDLAILYKMFDALTYIVDEEFAVAARKLSLSYDYVSKMNNENRYYYYYNKGLLSTHYHKRLEDAVVFFQKARDLVLKHRALLPDNVGRLEYNIAYCYSSLEMPYRAIAYLQACREVYVEDIRKNLELHIDVKLAYNCIHVDDLSAAQILLDKCLVKAKSIKSNPNIGYVMYCYGLLNIKTGNWATAIDYLDQAIELYEKYTDHYYYAYYYRIYCIARIRKFSLAKKETEAIMETCGTDEKWPILFESMLHLIQIRGSMTRLNYESIDFIQNITIPHCKKHREYYFAIDYCKLLLEHFKRSRSTINSLHMGELYSGLLERCFLKNDIGVK